MGLAAPAHQPQAIEFTERGKGEVTRELAPQSRALQGQFVNLDRLTVCDSQVHLELWQMRRDRPP
jgi:hypothetical protein